MGRDQTCGDSLGDGFYEIDKPSVWPNANKRLLGLAGGLPIKPIDRLGLFSADEFERFVLEWADGYLREKVPGVSDLQQRGGAGDKGRDIVVWFGEPADPGRYWHLYQCKRYSTALGEGTAIEEIGKVIYFAWRGDFVLPKQYWFVTRKGVTGNLQDLVDVPTKLKEALIANWDKYCATKIVSKTTVKLEGDLLAFLEKCDFSFVRVMQPLQILKEHSQTEYHKFVFGVPLVDRPKPPPPPSSIAEAERGYVNQLFAVISEMTGSAVTGPQDFSGHAKSAELFVRSRLAFYCAEGLKRLAHDQMRQGEVFDDLLEQFSTGLYFTYNAPAATGYERLASTVQAAQAQQISGHVLADHLTPNDREGVCHHLANSGAVVWCDHA